LHRHAALVTSAASIFGSVEAKFRRFVGASEACSTPEHDELLTQRIDLFSATKCGRNQHSRGVIPLNRAAQYCGYGGVYDRRGHSVCAQLPDCDSDRCCWMSRNGPQPIHLVDDFHSQKGRANGFHIVPAEALRSSSSPPMQGRDR